MKYILATILTVFAFSVSAADAAKKDEKAAAPAKAEAKCDPAKDKNCKVEKKEEAKK